MTDQIRLPNRTKKGLHIDEKTGMAVQERDEDLYMTPSFFLRGAASPDMGAFAKNDESEVRFEGEMIRKATETKLKKYWYCLLGKELYQYKSKSDEKHRGMHNLSGVFIKDESMEFFNNQAVVFLFTLIFPGNIQRTYYHETKQDKE